MSPASKHRNFRDNWADSRYKISCGVLRIVWCQAFILPLPSMKTKTRASHNEWNVPDWRDEKQYLTPRSEGDDSDLLQWRWEFLRRDKQYRDDWRRIAVLDPDGKLALRGDPSQCDFTKPIPLLIPEQLEDFHHFNRLYKLSRLLDPSVRNPSILPFSGLYAEYGVVVVVDLELSIKRQLKLAELELRRHHKQLEKKLRRATYPEKAKWPQFLRMIDALDTGQVDELEIGYEICGFRGRKYAVRKVISNVRSQLRRARSFWKKLPIPAVLPPKCLTDSEPSSAT